MAKTNTEHYYTICGLCKKEGPVPDWTKAKFRFSINIAQKQANSNNFARTSYKVSMFVQSKIEEEAGQSPQTSTICDKCLSILLFEASKQ